MVSRLPLSGLLHLGVTYLVWGSTYLAIRIAVREGAGWGPFWLGASRVAVASVVLLLITAWRSKRLRPSRSELTVLVVSGLLMWVGGNGGVNWAEQRVDSGLVALIIGTMPMWVALAEAGLDRRAPSPLLLGAIATGFAGLVVLTLPLLRGGVGGDPAGIAVVVLSTLTWGAGTLLVSRRPVGLGPFAMGGWQQLAGAVGFATLAMLVREPAPTPTPAAWGAWAYLVVFGSIFAFTSFIAALRLLPTSVVMTYTYVNPVIAVLLGWLVLDEPVTRTTLAGMGLILTGVWGVFRDRHRRARREA
jgi:drug/metabolite transporter (DMT)-like permease